ncbi:hypothetical protein DEO72_LG7g1533 [Vigna unguiculata]|uniref:Uncharacterized protein n=1 Tax=Vigna unguiculata TaxID=3917 RepID=A0A4D6MKI3_VIGUN|nr:hypothetical protein DEO72_LG7g1533 [Vigna unguiculata]
MRLNPCFIFFLSAKHHCRPKSRPRPSAATRPTTASATTVAPPSTAAFATARYLFRPPSLTFFLHARGRHLPFRKTPLPCAVTNKTATYASGRPPAATVATLNKLPMPT